MHLWVCEERPFHIEKRDNGQNVCGDLADKGFHNESEYSIAFFFCEACFAFLMLLDLSLGGFPKQNMLDFLYKPLQ